MSRSNPTPFDFSSASIATDELWFKAEMTHCQFLALAHKLDSSDIENEIYNLDYWNRINKSKNNNLQDIEKCLINSWNTENVLDSNHVVIDNTGQSFALQWAFTQAYYSCFGNLLAHFKAIGHTEFSHTAVLRKFGNLMNENKLPNSISFYSKGSIRQITYHNIDKPSDAKILKLELSNQSTVDNHICQFLKATREIKLIEKAPDFKFKTKAGGPKTNLGTNEWQRVSESVGNTTIMDLLYRKRIKANYQDIETFTYEGFKGKDVLTNLTRIVNRLNFANECYIAKAIGIDEFSKIAESHLKKVDNGILKNRLNRVHGLLTF